MTSQLELQHRTHQEASLRLWGKPAKRVPAERREAAEIIEVCRWPPYLPELPYDSHDGFSAVPDAGPGEGWMEGVSRILYLRHVRSYEVKSSMRSRHLVEARRAIARYLHDDRGWSTTKIGAFLNRDHSSICNMLNPNRRKQKYERDKFPNALGAVFGANGWTLRQGEEVDGAAG